MNKIVKAMNDYTCHHCGGKIDKGQKHEFGKGRLPTFSDKNEHEQVGIEYYQYRLCAECSEMF